MCGIVGQFKKNTPVDLEDIKKMAEAISHRGPDGEGYWLSSGKELGFGHKRLSIIDLSDNASQPMHSLDGRYTIVYNGEIYNYVELRKKLIAKGHKLITDSDTEVLLTLYSDYKGECLCMLDGMFAFAIWDNVEGSLFCARDRFGEKPFYYLLSSAGFIFASEIKSILKVQALSVNISAIDAYLNGVKSVKNPIYFEGIKSLTPSHYIVVKEDSHFIKKYWEIDLNKSITYKSEDEYTEHFKELFFTSVARRLRSDVPFGSCLSGGIDSSSIVSAINKIHGNGFKTLSIMLPDEQMDESRWINKMTEFTGVVNCNDTPSLDGLLNEFEKLLWHMEYPFDSASNYLQWCVMKLAKQHNIKVLLDGQGADEYLAGYADLKYFALWDIYRQFRIKDFIREKKSFKKNFGPAERLGYLYLFDPLLMPLGIKRKEYKYGCNLKDRLKYAITNEMEELMRNADRNSMAHSIEVRLPFLYHELVQFVFSIPPDKIYGKGLTKRILRNSMKDLLPHEIINRIDKVGFAPPQKKWVAESKFVESAQFMKEILVKNGLKPSSDTWKNYSAGLFLKIFSNPKSIS